MSGGLVASRLDVRVEMFKRRVGWGWSYFFADHFWKKHEKQALLAGDSKNCDHRLLLWNKPYSEE